MTAFEPVISRQHDFAIEREGDPGGRGRGRERRRRARRRSVPATHEHQTCIHRLPWPSITRGRPEDACTASSVSTARATSRSRSLPARARHPTETREQPEAVPRHDSLHSRPGALPVVSPSPSRALTPAPFPPPRPPISPRPCHDRCDHDCTEPTREDTAVQVVRALRRRREDQDPRRGPPHDRAERPEVPEQLRRGKHPSCSSLVRASRMAPEDGCNWAAALRVACRTETGGGVHEDSQLTARGSPYSSATTSLCTAATPDSSFASASTRTTTSSSGSRASTSSLRYSVSCS